MNVVECSFANCRLAECRSVISYKLEYCFFSDYKNIGRPGPGANVMSLSSFATDDGYKKRVPVQNKSNLLL